jgi:hypothetical protein
MRSPKALLHLAPLSMALTLSAFAQEVTSTMLGTVMDQADAVVPKATLTATELATGRAHGASSDESGLFRFNDLPPGQYKLLIQAPGFKALDMTGIELATAETRALGKLILQVGAVSDQITITAAATPVQTASSERADSVTPSQLNDISLKGRDPFSFVQLLPGVVDSLVGTRDIENAYSMGNLQINGANAQSVNVLMDGVTEMDEGGNFTAFVTPNIDSISEMRILTNGYAAEYGRQAGGTMNVITKSGGTSFHGTGHWDHRNDDLTANTFFNNRSGIQRPLYRYLILGYSIGGPAYIPKVWNRNKNKLFFFMSQEFTRTAQTTISLATNEPTALELGGNFSNSRNAAGAVIPVLNPTTGTAFPGNMAPASMIDPTGLAILKLLPAPNGYVNPAPGQQYTSNFLAEKAPTYNRRNTIMRFDANITSKLSMFYRWGQDVDNHEFPFVVSPGVGSNINFLPGYVHGVHATYIISPTTINEFNFGVGHDNYGFYHTTSDSQWFRTSSLNPPTLRPFPTGPGYENYLPCATFSGGAQASPSYFTPGGQQSPNPGCSLTPYKNFNDNYVFKDDLSKIIGKHSLKAGFYYEWNSKVEPSAGAQYYGNFNFGSTVNNPLDTGYGYANALLGIFQSYTEATNRAVPNVSFKQIEGYLQDSWRVTKKLTVDYGMRFVGETPVSDNSRTYSNFYKQLWDPKNAPVLYQQGAIGSTKVALNPLTGATTFNSLVGTIVPGSGNPVDGMHIDGLTGKGDFYTFSPLVFGPRLGFAWDPFGDGKTAIRASSGIFYNRTFDSVPGSGAPPVVYTPVIYYSHIADIPQDAAAEAISPTVATTIYGKQKIETDYQYNFTIQRDIGFNTVVDVAYVGNFDRHALQTYPLNPIPLNAYANPANVFQNTELTANLVRQAYPGMGAITYSSYSNSSVNYNGLQMTAQHRMTNGLAFGAAYTFSKALGSQGLDPYHNQRQWYYGPLPQDRKSLLTFNFLYTIPAGAIGWKPAKVVLRNWQLSGVGIATTGAPINPVCSSSAAFPFNDPSLTGVGAITQTPSTTTILGYRCQEVTNPQNFTQSFYSNFNTAAFTLAPTGTFGNAGLYILRQPTWWNFDTSLDKKISIKERVALRLRFQAFNVFNHTEFDQIGATYLFNAAGVNTNSTTGQFTKTQPQRQMALTVRLEF